MSGIAGATGWGRGRFSMFAASLAIAALAVLAESEASAEDALECPDGEECVVIHSADSEHLFTVEWAITPPQRACGLMFREEMAEDHGMVFDFLTERSVSFWMRNTLIPLDMIFIDEDGIIVNIAEMTTPLSDDSVPAAAPVRYVFEVVGGTAERLGIEAGDTVELERAEGMTEGTAICAPPPGP